MKRKAIVLISNNYWTLFRFRYEIIKHLVQKGFNVHLIAEMDGYEDKLIMDDAVTLHNVKFSGRSINPLNEIRTFLQIKKILIVIKPIFLFSYTIKPNIYSGYICSNLKIDHVAMVTGFGYFFNILKKPLRNIVHYIIKKSFLHTKEVWFTNLSDQKYYLDNKIISKSKNTSLVMGAGVDFDNIPVIKNDKDSEKTFIMIARLLNEKGTFEFIQAAKYFFKFNKYKFYLIGNHENNKHYIKKYIVDHAVRDNILEYLEFTDDIDKYYNRASCIVLPAYREGLSTVLLEAASRKIPIITTDVPGCRDIIKDESYGFLCRPKSPQSLVDAMGRFIKASDGDLTTRKENVYKYVKENCSKNSIIEKYDKILDL